jgi:CHAD domain-containing protein
MAYRLSFADDLASSVRQCAREQLADALARLGGAAAEPVTAVHEARKDLKKTRALLRLVRPALGRGAYRAENDALRGIALALSGARDADVRVATARALAEQAAGQLPADVFDALGEALAAEASAGRDGGEAAAGRFAAPIEALGAARLRVETWPLDEAGWDTVLAGITRAYARGREAFATARTTPEPELLHAWRKRAKDLWYHQRLLTPAWPEVLGAQADAAHVLSELLGDDHDLAVLVERLHDEAPPLAPAVDARREELRALIAHRSDRLRTQAAQLGRRIYAESPKAFSRRIARYLKLAVDEAQAEA